MTKIAINGFGRIGRLIFRIMDSNEGFDVAAINDLTSPEQLAYLLKYDTSYRHYKYDQISFTDSSIIVGSKEIKVFCEKDPHKLPWQELGIDIVMECSGAFTDKEKAMAHIIAGAKKVIISAPAKGELKTIVYNVNEKTLDGSEEIISAASCTTNCLAPVLNVINNAFGIKQGFMTTIHAYTNDQVILDVAHKKGIASRRGRSAAMNIIPTSTGAASAIGNVIPSLEGKLEGSAMRVPVPTGSVVDLTLELNQRTTVDELNKTFAANSNETLKITYDPVVSSDIIGSSCGALVDGLLTKINEVDNKQLVKIIAWYDNEMGYSYQMVRTAQYLMKIMK